MVGFNLLNQTAREYSPARPPAKMISAYLIMFAIRRALSQSRAKLKTTIQSLVDSGEVHPQRHRS